MPKRMIVHDKRLEGKAPRIAQNTYVVDQPVDISHCIGWVGQYARQQGGLDELMIMCHGFEGNFSIGQQMSTLRASGGFGLQLCRQGLSLENVNLCGNWRGFIQKITVYACAPADTGPGNENTIGDGRRFMGEFALFSGAEVIAARDTQMYRHSWLSRIDFGEWEGPVFSFSPITGEGTRLASPSAMR
jgi:hypothetical protein